MTQHEASRTLVKSPPELWAECSDASSLGRHLDQFGEIRITRLEPETAVAWEGELASGTVRLEPSGWGTKVFLTAESAMQDEDAEAAEVAEVAEVVDEAVAVEVVPEAEPEAEAVVQSEPEPVREPAPAAEAPALRRRGFFAWLRSWFEPPDEQPGAFAAAVQSAAQPEPEPVVPELAPVVPELAPVATQPDPAPDPKPEVPARPLAPVPDPEPGEHPESEDGPDPLDPAAVLTAALDSLGQAHHRPFSRA